MSLGAFALPVYQSVMRPWRAPPSTISISLAAIHPATTLVNSSRSSFPVFCANFSSYDGYLSLCGNGTRDALRRMVATFAAMAFLSSCSPLSAIAASGTPFSQSLNEKMQTGLLNGSIRPCPSDINPNCISTSSKTAVYAIPWRIPPNASETAARKIVNAILSTQKNSRIVLLEDTPNGQFVEAEVKGRFGNDVLEFLVKDGVVMYRSMAEKVVYFYPFTTPLTDFGMQQRRINALQDELGWSDAIWDSSE